LQVRKPPDEVRAVDIAAMQSLIAFDVIGWQATRAESTSELIHSAGH
jgi:hypothetical protein